MILRSKRLPPLVVQMVGSRSLSIWEQLHLKKKTFLVNVTNVTDISPASRKLRVDMCS